jgi:hypothetical protein
VLRQFFGRIWQTLWQPPKSNFVDLKDDESSRFGLALRSIGRRRLFRRRAYDLSPSERTRHPMSKIDRRTEVTPSPSLEEQRILMRALGCSVEELVTRLGPENAIKRVETELRRARRARSQAPRVLERRSRHDRDGHGRGAEHEAHTKRAAYGRAG